MDTLGLPLVGDAARQRALSFVAAAAVALGTAACGQAGDDPGSAAPASVVAALEAAETEGDASPAQLAVLENALREGREITEEEYRAAFALAVECTRDAGVKVIAIDEVYDAGSVELYMKVNGREEDEDFMFTTMGVCEQRHSTYLDLARRLSQTARSTRDAIIEEFRPAMRECVRAKGVHVPEDATYDEIVSQDPDIVDGRDPAETCVSTTGLQDALGSR